MLPHLKRPATRVAAIVLAVLSLSGCSADVGDENNGTENVPAEVTRSGPEAEPLLPTPLQAYRLTPSELATINYARGLLIDRCMRSAGFAYPQQAYTQAVKDMFASERTAIGRRYGITDAQLAAAHGYGFDMPTELGPPGNVERVPSYLEALRGSDSAAQADRNHGSTADRGKSDDGCVGVADRALGSTSPDASPFGLAHSLWVQGQQRLTETSQYRSTVDDWAACMTRQGHHVSDPINDQRDIAEVFRARQVAGDPALIGRPTPGEISLATADVDCKKTVRLVERLDAVSSVIDQRSIVAHRVALERDHRRLEQTLAIASDLLANHGP